MSAINTNPALTSGLQAAVPLWILQLAAHDQAARDRIRTRWAREAAEAVAHRGDVLQYGGGKRGEAARVFNCLARGLAAAAYNPGGITFAGIHWCVDHAECRAAERDATANPLTDTGPEPAPPANPTYRGRAITTINLPEVA